MKYRDLIEKLLPVADEEINMTTVHDFCYYDPSDADNETGYNEDEVSFFRSSEDSNDIICTVKQKYDSETFDNIDEAKILTY